MTVLALEDKAWRIANERLETNIYSRVCVCVCVWLARAEDACWNTFHIPQVSRSVLERGWGKRTLLCSKLNLFGPELWQVFKSHADLRTTCKQSLQQGILSRARVSDGPDRGKPRKTQNAVLEDWWKTIWDTRIHYLLSIKMEVLNSNKEVENLVAGAGGPQTR